MKERKEEREKETVKEREKRREREIRNCAWWMRFAVWIDGHRQFQSHSISWQTKIPLSLECNVLTFYPKYILQSHFNASNVSKVMRPKIDWSWVDANSRMDHCEKCWPVTVTLGKIFFWWWKQRKIPLWWWNRGDRSNVTVDYFWVLVLGLLVSVFDRIYPRRCRN